MNINDLMQNFQVVVGDFQKLNIFNFHGVYIIYDPNNGDEVVYVGSAYVRTIESRLNQYTKAYDTGNTLMHAICKKDFNVAKVKDITKNQKDEAVKEILKLKIQAIQHNDLEYQMISKASPKYNTAGVEIDTLEDEE